MSHGFAASPKTPYYAVIFTSQRTAPDDEYDAMGNAMYELALKQEGCLGAESARGPDGLGITVSYFSAAAAIQAWTENVEHRLAQKLGKEK
jgi:heme-degrading monooxygenase HmoA